MLSSLGAFSPAIRLPFPPTVLLRTSAPQGPFLFFRSTTLLGHFSLSPTVLVRTSASQGPFLLRFLRTLYSPIVLSRTSAPQGPSCPFVLRSLSPLLRRLPLSPIVLVRTSASQGPLYHRSFRTPRPPIVLPRTSAPQGPFLVHTSALLVATRSSSSLAPLPYTEAAAALTCASPGLPALGVRRCPLP